MSKKLKRLTLTFPDKVVDVTIPWRIGSNNSWILLDIYDAKTKKSEAMYYLMSAKDKAGIEIKEIP